MTNQILMTSVEQHVWATISAVITPFIITPPQDLTPQPTSTPSLLPPSFQSSPLSQWTWKPPDLSVGGEFYKTRVQNLRKAIGKLDLDHDFWYKHGLELLKAH